MSSTWNGQKLIDLLKNKLLGEIHTNEQLKRNEIIIEFYKSIDLLKINELQEFNKAKMKITKLPTEVLNYISHFLIDGNNFCLAFVLCYLNHDINVDDINRLNKCGIDIDYINFKRAIRHSPYNILQDPALETYYNNCKQCHSIAHYDEEQWKLDADEKCKSQCREKRDFINYYEYIDFRCKFTVKINDTYEVIWLRIPLQCNKIPFICQEYIYSKEHLLMLLFGYYSDYYINIIDKETYITRCVSFTPDLKINRVPQTKSYSIIKKMIRLCKIHDFSPDFLISAQYDELTKLCQITGDNTTSDKPDNSIIYTLNWKEIILVILNHDLNGYYVIVKRKNNKYRYEDWLNSDEFNAIIIKQLLDTSYDLYNNILFTCDDAIIVFNTFIYMLQQPINIVYMMLMDMLNKFELYKYNISIVHIINEIFIKKISIEDLWTRLTYKEKTLTDIKNGDWP